MRRAKISGYVVHPEILVILQTEAQWTDQVCFKENGAGLYFMTNKIDTVGTKDYNRAKSEPFYDMATDLHNQIFNYKEKHAQLVHITGE